VIQIQGFQRLCTQFLDNGGAVTGDADFSHLAGSTHVHASILQSLVARHYAANGFLRGEIAQEMYNWSEPLTGRRTQPRRGATIALGIFTHLFTRNLAIAQATPFG
jgi:hypothetical protein